MSFGAEKIDLSTVDFTPELVSAIPAATARFYQIVPVYNSFDVVCIAMKPQPQLQVIDQLVFILGRSLQVLAADERQIALFVKRLYPSDER